MNVALIHTNVFIPNKRHMILSYHNFHKINWKQQMKNHKLLKDFQ